MNEDTGNFQERDGQRAEENARDLRAERRSRRRKRRRRRTILYRTVFALVLIDLLLLFAVGIRAGIRHYRGRQTAEESSMAAESSSRAEESSLAEAALISEQEKEEGIAKLLSDAERMALQYNYDGAVGLLSGSEYHAEEAVSARIAEYEAVKQTLQPADNRSITHIFFHSLIVDVDRALTPDKSGSNYNSAMTTIPEFEKILSEMYERGYVLVGLHDVAETEVGEDGKKRLVQKQILLPEGKKPFIMSQDDVNYYEYMEGHGFAEKMVLDENGRLKLQYTDAEGNVSIGDYDLVPILDRFIEEHPDFSYHGHKAIIAFTGYNGVLGYRTDETYDASSPAYDPKNKANENIEADRETVRTLTKALTESGYEIASHSWGHINFTNRSLETLTLDTDRWERNVETLLPEPCDILIYPFGADIRDWHAYDHAEDQKFNMLTDAGFHFFCNVDSSISWVQFGEDFMRQGRRNLDGYRLYEAFSGRADHVSDLMDIQEVFDTRRPTPIGWDY